MGWRCSGSLDGDVVAQRMHEEVLTHWMEMWWLIGGEVVAHWMEM